MKLLFLLIAIILFSAVMMVKQIRSERASRQNIRISPLPAEKVPNDKLFIVEGANDEEIRMILQDFCRQYDEDNQSPQRFSYVMPRFHKLASHKFAITFPYDINFDLFCLLISYAAYPIAFDRPFKSVGWCTLPPADPWVAEEIAHKPVMLYVSPSDIECDNVLLTTSDNVAYQLSFSKWDIQPIVRDKEYYVNPPAIN